MRPQMRYVRRAGYAEEIFSLLLIFILAISMTQTAYATSISDLQKQRQEKKTRKKAPRASWIP